MIHNILYVFFFSLSNLLFNKSIISYGFRTFADSLVSFAAGYADEFFYATSITQGFGVLHVLGDDFVQRAADGSHRVVGHGLAGRSGGPGGPTAGGVVVAAATTTAW